MSASPDDHTTPLAYPALREPQCPYQPPSEYAKLIEHDGLVQAQLRHGDRVWLVARYDEVRATLADRRISADITNPHLPVPVHGRPTFARMDDPEHARLRRLFTSAFTVRNVNALRGSIETVVERTLDAFASGPNPGDLMRDYALPVTSQMICLMLGVPYEDHQYFEEKAAAAFQLDLDPGVKKAAFTEMFEYTRKLVNDRVPQPTDDLVGRQAAHIAAGELNLEDAVMNTMGLLVAGHETTSSMICLAILVLLEHPEQLARIRDTEDASVVARAIEELLRYITIAETAIVRVATDDLTIGSHRVRKNDGLVMCLPAANRDGKFAGANDLDIDRDAHGHLAFGFGAHQCLGQNLARLELQIAVPALLRRLPHLKLAVGLEELRMRLGILSVEKLPVTW
ncbi:cytochrome P450 [Amycolatopsis sp. SID8362]|uniref:cytochrome P450 n=1 Tax=Amycolatopsis sp. SID8362 TaxID=2690346 RepID=UPI00136BC468|nr:cytochrome P450 [Amycolatopsis sp. SID8362]NBH12149.1 cytochrome P450 [Amycolatopsis sp. SID8362]NED48841.1 cytochrome P450 [Amycolatopsis sp. SID8362]